MSDKYKKYTYTYVQIPFIYTMVDAELHRLLQRLQHLGASQLLQQLIALHFADGGSQTWQKLLVSVALAVDYLWSLPIFICICIFVCIYDTTCCT